MVSQIWWILYRKGSLKDLKRLHLKVSQGRLLIPCPISEGDGIALLCGAGHNLRKILARIRLLWLWMVWVLISSREPELAVQSV